MGPLTCVHESWEQVAKGIQTLKPAVSGKLRMVREDLSHPDWDDPASGDEGQDQPA